MLGFQLYRSPARKLDPKLRELGQLRAGWARGSRFMFSQHCKAARAVGLDASSTMTSKSESPRSPHLTARDGRDADGRLLRR